ncbi:hypothetical protein TNCV_3733991 [Trichonephila clavipes]|nr:hypothetical protein TNCV_3733991 [Trichonephila clavipes]
MISFRQRRERDEAPPRDTKEVKNGPPSSFHTLFNVNDRLERRFIKIDSACITATLCYDSLAESGFELAVQLKFCQPQALHHDQRQLLNLLEENSSKQNRQCYSTHKDSHSFWKKDGGRQAKLSKIGYIKAVGSCWLEHGTPDRKAWVRCPMLPNTLRVHAEYVLVKSVGPKVLCTESRVQGTGEYFPSIVPSGNFAELIRTVTCMVLQVNDRRTSSPLPR